MTKKKTDSKNNSLSKSEKVRIPVDFDQAIDDFLAVKPPQKELSKKGITNKEKRKSIKK